MKFVLTRNIEELPDNILRQLETNNRSDFSNSLEWYQTFSRYCLGEGASPLFLGGQSGSGTDAVSFALAMQTPAGQPGSHLPYSLLRGKTLASLTNYQSIFYAPVFSTGGATAAAISLLGRGIKEKLSHCALLDFSSCDPKTRGAHQIAMAFRLGGFSVSPYVCGPNLVELTEGRSYSDYLAGRSRQCRYDIKRAWKRLAELGNVEFTLVKDCKDLQNHIADYERVFQASWKDPEPFPRFTAEIMRAAARSGTMRLGFLHLDGKPIATEFWIVSAGRCSMYKIHYDAAYSGKLSIGTLLTVKMIEYAIERDRVREIDFGIGDEPHKAKLMSLRRELGGVVAFNRQTVAGLLSELEYLTRKSAKKSKKKITLAIKSAVPDSAVTAMKSVLTR